MIISRTPMRISFVGGGTDLKAFYKYEPGRVISAAINKYIYICVHKHFDGQSFLLKYSKVEEGTDINKIKNNIIREAMKLTGVRGVEIVSMSDMPVSGIGLGSSSSFTVGLLNALYAYQGKYKTAEELAQQACQIEIKILKKPIGKQDQYIAAYGGLKLITFYPNEKVKVNDLPISENQKKGLDSNLMLFFTGITRKADKILAKQKKNTKNKFNSLKNIKNLTTKMKRYLLNSQIDKIGELLNKNWEEKRKLARGITNEKIEKYYTTAIQSGALGGKISGAGGGGFLLLYCRKKNQNSVRRALEKLGLTEVNFGFDSGGSKIIYHN